MAFDYPAAFFAPRAIGFRGAAADRRGARARPRALLRDAKRPLIVAGGGVLYATRPTALRAFAERMACRSPRRRPARARWRGIIRCSSARSASPARPRRTRSRATPIVVLAVGTRLQDFTTGSHSLFAQARARQPQRQRASTRSKWRGVAAGGRRAPRRSTALSRALSATGAPTPPGRSARATAAERLARATSRAITGRATGARCPTKAK